MTESHGVRMAIKLRIESGGCSGFQYIIDVVPSSSVCSTYKLFEQSGCLIAVDDTSLSFVDSCEIDYTEDMVRSAFQVVKNDFAAARCGCGSSFNIGFYRSSLFILRYVSVVAFQSGKQNTEFL